MCTGEPWQRCLEVGVWVRERVRVKTVVFVPSVSDVPGSGIYFGVYVYLLRTLTPVGKRYVCLWQNQVTMHEAKI